MKKQQEAIENSVNPEILKIGDLGLWSSIYDVRDLIALAKMILEDKVMEKYLGNYKIKNLNLSSYLG